MMRYAVNTVARRVALAAVLLMLAAMSCAEDGGSLQQVVSGVEIYLGIVPAEMVGGHPREHPERGMHGGTASGGYHVMVALFDHATGQRITDAEVSARLVSPSRQEPEKRLEAMTVAGALTYGNFFNMVRGGSYRMDIQIRRPGSPDVVRATFRLATN